MNSNARQFKECVAVTLICCVCFFLFFLNHSPITNSDTVSKLWCCCCCCWRWGFFFRFLPFFFSSFVVWNWLLRVFSQHYINKFSSLFGYLLSHVTYLYVRARNVMRIEWHHKTDKIKKRMNYVGVLIGFLVVKPYDKVILHNAVWLYPLRHTTLLIDNWISRGMDRWANVIREIDLNPLPNRHRF